MQPVYNLHHVLYNLLHFFVPSSLVPSCSKKYVTKLESLNSDHQIGRDANQIVVTLLIHLGCWSMPIFRLKPTCMREKFWVKKIKLKKFPGVHAINNF